VTVRAVAMALPGVAPEWAVWESEDWDDLARAIGWIIAGTHSFWLAARANSASSNEDAVL